MTDESPPPLMLLVVLLLFVLAFFGGPILAEFVGAYWPRETEPSPFRLLADGGIE